MPLPKNPQAYGDVRSVLDAAVASGGATYTLRTRNEAIRWRSRAHMLRRLLWDRGEITPWDNYEFVLAGPSVVIREKEVGTLQDLQNNPLEPLEEADPILEEVEALKRKLDLET